MAKKNKKKKWMKFRHRAVRNIASAILRPYCYFKYGIKPERFAEQNGRQYLILLNHTTPFDQFFVGMCFKGPIYYLATEDIFSKGFISSVIRYLVAPIPIKKQANDAAAVLNCLRVAREGGTICIAPEGNRTYSGKTEYINPTISMLAKRLKLPIAIFRIEGGYGAQPRWSDCVRKGKMRCYVHSVIEPEEYKEMSDDELYTKIVDGLYVNDTESPISNFTGKRKAEYLERAVYVCPDCKLSEFYSKGNICKCMKCGKSIEYGEDLRIRGVDCEFPFKTVTEWYEYQKDFVNSFDTLAYIDQPIFEEDCILDEVIVYKKKQPVAEVANVSFYGNRIEIDSNDFDEKMVFDFDNVTAMAVLGRNKANIYIDGRVFQLRGDRHFNALKYVNLYYRYRNQTKGDENGQFLGL
ncbi:MAG: 1-acyl-sn-glycerol-3-phosphate acyltransferase [Ruminococcaceae bacterium]|nr:1-acyl-sn-glycerol-3-phosphate acyltransferase [Oscillospiraceae bacterium]